MNHPFFGITIAHLRYVEGASLGANNSFQKTSTAEGIGPTIGTDIYFSEKKKGFLKFQMDYLFNINNANGVIGEALFIKGGVGVNIN